MLTTINMTNERYIKGNKLIAKYVGWDFVKLPINDEYPEQQWISGVNKYNRNWDSKECVWTTEPNFDAKCKETIEFMWNSLCNPSYGRCGQYHYNYEYIMPIVERLEEDGFDVDIMYKSCFITKRSDKNIAFSGVGNTKIEAIWIAITSLLEANEVEQFIK